MKTSPRALLAVLTVFFFSAAVLSAEPDFAQPHMKEAVELLHKAQGAHEPVPFLRAAKKQLEESERDKGGFRVEAIKIVDHAIAEAELGHPVKMEENIAAAITAIHDGIAHAR